MRWALPILVAIAARAVADPAPSPASSETRTVALLPLATGKGFALYGQPVASEVARALKAGGIEVVVVSAGAPVPARARLVVDGSIEGSDGGAVKLQVRVRDPDKGIVITTLDASAPELGALDRAAAALAAKLLPVVSEHLTAKAAAPPRPDDETHPHVTTIDPTPLRRVPGPDVRSPAIDFGTSTAPAFPVDEAARVARALIERTGRRPVDGAPLSGRPLAGDWGLAIQVTKLEVKFDGVYTARATARVRWVDVGGHVVLDRVVHTDTVVGDQGGDRTAIMRAAGDELVEILEPRVKAWSEQASLSY